MSYFSQANVRSKSAIQNHSSKNQSGYSLPYIRPYKGARNEQSTTEQMQDYGPYPFVVNIEQAAKNNTNFRTALWTGTHLQITLMSLLPGEEIGLEVHDHLDQFINIVQGRGMLMMGDSADQPNVQQNVTSGMAFTIPAGKYHNLINIGNTPIKLFSIYAPPQHPFGTVHKTKADADAAEAHH